MVSGALNCGSVLENITGLNHALTRKYKLRRKFWINQFLNELLKELLSFVFTDLY